jgi:DNA (cytosine-5)-methyltransferase 1
MKIKAIDLFCGVGGLTHGLQLAGINVVAGFDIEESCCYPYEINNKSKFILSDVAKITREEIDLLLEGADVKIIAGCAPCQPFSLYSQRYRKDGHKDDKWKLLYSFANIIKECLPDIVAMENVPQLKHEEVFLDFVNTLECLKYNVYFDIVFCPDYGVPQQRKRLVLLASKTSQITMISPEISNKNYKTVRQAIEHLPPIQAGEICESDKLHQASRLSEKNLKRIKQSKPGRTWRDWDKGLILSCHSKSSGKSYSSVYGRMSWDEVSPTITTQFYGLGNGRFGHPEQDRAISLREGAILQSFPPDYQFVSNDTKINKRKLGTQIGNAVPVELGRAIGLSILKSLEVDHEEEKK